MNQKIDTRLGTIIILIIAVTVGAYVWQWEKKDEIVNQPLVLNGRSISNHKKIENEAIAAKIIGENISIPTDTWKSYTDDVNGYSINYPSDWILSSSDGTTISIPSVKDNIYQPNSNINGDYAISISTYKGIGTNKNLKQWITDPKDGQNIYSDVTIKNFPAIEIDNNYSGKNLLRTVNYFFIDQNNDGFNIRVVYRNSRDHVGDRIISTLNIFDHVKDLDSYQDISSEKQALNKIDVENISPKSLINSLYDSIFKSRNNISSKVNQNDCIYWKRNDGINFGSNGWEVTSTRPDLSTINSDIEVLSHFFTNNGFKKNKENTFVNSTSDPMYVPGQSMGFEKENLRCLIKWSELTPDVNPRDLVKDGFNVSCKQYSSEDENNFQTFSTVLGTGVTKFLCVKKQERNYAWGDSSHGAWYGKRTSEHWNIVWSGQDSPRCTEIAGFPEEVYKTCEGYK